jgi:hypothetical protein
VEFQVDVQNDISESESSIPRQPVGLNRAVFGKLPLLAPEPNHRGAAGRVETGYGDAATKDSVTAFVGFPEEDPLLNDR